MSVNVYARAAKIHNASGRLDYMTNPNRQENLLAVAGLADAAYWAALGSDAQAAWRTAGGTREKAKCCEAREIHGDLPNSALSGDLKELAEKLAADFRDRTGADCVVAIHLNKKNNLHYHLMFSERQRLPEPVIRVADRAAYLDETGLRRRTKKEILDAEGQLRPGCRIVPKGEILDIRYFGEKEPIFKEKGWLYDYKKHMADWINQELQPDQKRTVYDAAGPYLAQLHVGNGKAEEKKQRIEVWNENVRIFNAAVRDGRISEQRAREIKAEVMLSPNRNAALVIATRREFAAEAPKMSVVEAGGARTRVSPNDPREKKKQQLRSLYQKAADLRNQARSYPEGSLDRTRLMGDARTCSAQIDRLRLELGYYKPEDYVRRQRKIDEELRRKREWALRTRERARLRVESWFGLHRSIKDLRKELFELEMKIFPSKADKSRMASIRAQIPKLEEAKERVLEEEWRAKRAAKEAKKAYREAKKQARIQRRELQESQRLQVQRGRTGPER